MSIKDLSCGYGLSVKMLRYLEGARIIDCNNISPEQEFFLKSLVLIYDKPQFIKQQIARYNRTERARIVFGAGLSPLEGEILSRWLGHYADTEYSYDLSVKAVVAEIMQNKKLPASKIGYVTDIVHRMRAKARNLVYRNNTGDLVEKARALTIPKKARHKREERCRNRRSKGYSQNELFGF